MSSVGVFPVYGPPVAAALAAPYNWKHDVLMRSIKIIDIGYITVIYFLLGFYISVYVDHKLGEFDEQAAKNKSTLRLTVECMVHIYLIGVLVYVMRNVVEKIPFPLDGYKGFVHLKVKEVTNATVFVFIFLIFQYHLRKKLDYLRKRIFGGEKKE